MEPHPPEVVQLDEKKRGSAISDLAVWDEGWVVCLLLGLKKTPTKGTNQRLPEVLCFHQTAGLSWFSTTHLAKVVGFLLVGPRECYSIG